MKVDWKKEITNIVEQINNNISYEEIGRSYGVSGSYIRKLCKKEGIFLKQRRKINSKEHFNKGHRTKVCLNCGKEIESDKKFCNSQCYVEYKTKEKINLWLENPKDFNSEYTYNFIKQYLMSIHENKCEKCGWGEVNENTGCIPLEIHHIDGDCTNNDINNLQLLCPNCHSLTKTHGSRNTDSKRYKLKEYKHSLSKNRLIKLIDNLNEVDKQDIKEYILGD